jgi:hypothetical protein
LPALSNGRSSLAVSTIRPVPHQVALESLDQQGSIVRVLGHLPAAHLQVNLRVTPPIILLEFRDLEFGWHCHVGELGHTKGICVPKELRPRMSRIFSSESSILLSNWGSLSLGFGSVGGLGSGSMLM